MPRRRVVDVQAETHLYDISPREISSREDRPSTEGNNMVISQLPYIRFG
jgi:hypothetical protein